MHVPGIGAATFTQCAGFDVFTCRGILTACTRFLLVHAGTEPLDGTRIHPESYTAARALLRHMHASAIGSKALTAQARCATPFPSGKYHQVTELMESRAHEALARGAGLSVCLVEQLLRDLQSAGQADPRDAFAKVVQCQHRHYSHRPY